MQFTKYWVEKGSPGSAEALTGNNRKKNTSNIADWPKNVKGTGIIYGATVYFAGSDGTVKSGRIDGEFCPCIPLGLHWYKVTTIMGGSAWIPGKDLYRTIGEAESDAERRKRWTSY